MKFTVKSNMKKKAERTVAISMSLYLELLEKELKEANDAWGNDATRALTPKLLELIEDTEFLDGSSDNDPSYISDNFVVNGEFISKSEFTEDGPYSGYFSQYNGDWQALCDDALVYDENYACMRF